MDVSGNLQVPTQPSVSLKGLVLTLAGVVVGGPGYYWSYMHHSTAGTVVGVIGVALCILGTAKAEGPVHR
ncbi:hypothetical protein [Methylobacterium nodulans]|uniref:Uncharacterized protein n=1 Tax=Methylobacterium nodulans (strain LMG 21967 / CNCM I-2342 / ORS 2060) TaxID=460265 RepID=B8ICN1_METNO|nr:hypothetical protein [Methylobacterium nodulans]ACL57442.1 conserved hypothetical protein [Methylobacterium nodulans ORS 2060]